MSVDYATADGTAKAGTDYIATAGTATFAAGQTAVRVDVPVLGNLVAQPDRALRFVLSNPSGAPLAFGESQGTILDDDTTRTFLELASDPGDWAGGGQSQTLTPLDGTFTATTGPGWVGAAFSGASSWSLVFVAPSGMPLVPGVYEGAARYPFQSPTAPGMSVGGGGCNTLTGRFVVLEFDVGPDGVRKLAVDFEQHCEGIGPALLGSIRFNSLLSTVPRLSVAGAAAYEGNGQPRNLGFQVSLSRRSAAAVSFGYATADGSARAGTDYAATAGTASLPAGQTSARVDVPILGNRKAEPDRTLALSLANVTGAPVAFGQAQGVIRDDDSAQSLLYLASDPGDWVGGGQTTTLTQLDGLFRAGGVPQSQIYVQFIGTTNWYLTFSPPSGGTLAPGTYEHAEVPVALDAGPRRLRRRARLQHGVRPLRRHRGRVRPVRRDAGARDRLRAALRRGSAGPVRLAPVQLRGARYPASDSGPDLHAHALPCRRHAAGGRPAAAGRRPDVLDRRRVRHPPDRHRPRRERHGHEPDAARVPDDLSRRRSAAVDDVDQLPGGSNAGQQRPDRRVLRRNRVDNVFLDSAGTADFILDVSGYFQ